MPLTKAKYKLKKIRKNVEIKINTTFWIVELLLIGMITLLFYFNAPIQTAKVLKIPSGSIGSIVAYLSEKNINIGFFDSIMIRLFGQPQSGWLNFHAQKNTRLDFIYQLTNGKVATITITLIPGETYYFFLQDIAKKFNLSEEKLQQYYNAYAKQKDGNILAESYYLPIEMDEESIIKYLINYTETKYQDLSLKLFGSYDEKKWRKYIIVASIVQKEAANTKEMPIVASVIYNRLQKNMPLQMDGSLNYGKFSHTKITPTMIANDMTTYNTYKYKGLPKDAVCAVSIESIKAAIFPNSTNYVYFVKRQGSKTHSFSDSYNKHLQNIHE